MAAAVESPGNVAHHRRSEHDDKVNLKAELEIRLLHEKIDHLLMQQNQQMVEIQQLQLDMLEEIMEQFKKKSHTK